jgi:hypothetical protein
MPFGDVGPVAPHRAVGAEPGVLPWARRSTGDGAVTGGQVRDLAVSVGQSAAEAMDKTIGWVAVPEMT